jgi:hypothetical protein
VQSDLPVAHRDASGVHRQQHHHHEQTVTRRFRPAFRHDQMRKCATDDHHGESPEPTRGRVVQPPKSQQRKQGEAARGIEDVQIAMHEPIDDEALVPLQVNGAGGAGIEEQAPELISQLEHRQERHDTNRPLHGPDAVPRPPDGDGRGRDAHAGLSVRHVAPRS